jgi:HEPN domain-containing protein
VAQKAEEDFTTAQYLLTLKEKCPFGIVTFHAQQCAEKYLKALLTLHAVPFPKTHDLPELLSRVPEDLSLAFIPFDVGLLNRYAVEGRYPGDWDPITQADAEQAVALARTVREQIRIYLPKETLEP